MVYHIEDCECVDPERGVKLIVHLMSGHRSIERHQVTLALHGVQCGWCHYFVAGLAEVVEDEATLDMLPTPVAIGFREDQMERIEFVRQLLVATSPN